ncbi:MULTISPECIES: hypothetical protein [unclassified Microbulbifer]|uniref:hypothetical protein n=1 Tax=unclassified Microbulbifer TaxID=2619833 RepID=UPI0027E42680|nr:MULTISPECIES: hypothetical protein [unclassified Microbulbifer]
MEKKKATPSRSGPKQAVITPNNNTPKDPTKLERVLAYLATGRSLHRFEAEREVNDHCLPSTMSEIKHGLCIPYRVRYETVPGWHGHPTRVARYWLGREEQAQAWQRVFAMRKRRGVSP